MRKSNRRAALLLGALCLGLSSCGPVSTLPLTAPASVRALGSSVADQIRADNERRRTANPDGYARKLARLADNPYSFFRGTAPQFYRRLFAALPAELRQAPETYLHGDLHVENFAVVPSPEGLTYGVDDFDESMPGPASIDLIRCMASMVVAFGEDEKLLDSYLDGYRKGLDGKAHFDSDAIAKILRKDAKATQAEMLAKRTTPTRPRQMVVDENGLALKPDARKAVAASIMAAHLPGLTRLPFEDALQHFAGTASLDLFRFEAVYGDGGDKDLIVEIKELLPSVLSPHLGSRGDNLGRYQQGVQHWQGNSALPVASSSFGPYTMLVRYRPAYKASVTPDDVKNKDRQTFAEDLGKITGLGHTRGVSGTALSNFVERHHDALIRTAIEQARTSLADYHAFRGSR